MAKREIQPKLTAEDYQSLAEFRHRIRAFLHFSEAVVRDAGLEPRQHQLMLALKGLPPSVRPRIGELADRMQIEHHSAVEMVNRLEAGGVVRRERGIQDRGEDRLKVAALRERGGRERLLDRRLERYLAGPA